MARIGIVLAVLLAASGALAAEAADAWAESALGKATLGELWLGEPFEKEDLRGQVVLLEFWGYRCGPCIASIPHVSKINTTYGRRGLAVIGAHAQGNARREAVSIARQQGANYTIIARAAVPGVSFNGIPHAVVFDHTGTVLWHGHPRDRAMEQAIVAGLKKRPHPLLGDTQYKAMRTAAQHVLGGRLGRAWKLCEAKKDEQGPAGTEARALRANLQRHAARLKRRAETFQTEGPSRCLETLRATKTQFAGCDFAQSADEKLKELAKDGVFQKELKAERLYATIAGACARVPPCPTEARQKARWVARYRGAALQIKARVDQLQKLYPDSRSAAKAQELFQDLTGEP